MKKGGRIAFFGALRAPNSSMDGPESGNNSYYYYQYLVVQIVRNLILEKEKLVILLLKQPLKNFLKFLKMILLFLTLVRVL